jgi:hypothetical protein
VTSRWPPSVLNATRAWRGDERASTPAAGRPHTVIRMLECAVPAAYQLDHVYRLNKSLYVMARTFPVVRTRERWKTRVKKTVQTYMRLLRTPPQVCTFY